MELIIQTEDFHVKVDTEAKFKKGDILCGYVKEYPNFQDKDAPPRIPAYWFLSEVESDRIGRFYNVVDKFYKVVKIY